MLSGKDYNNARFFLLVDENSYNHCLASFISRVSRVEESEFLEVPVGEECKDLAIASQLWQTLLESNADRDTVIINIGGGCVSDLGGLWPQATSGEYAMSMSLQPLWVWWMLP
jgi:3-dehydroquinate synthase